MPSGVITIRKPGSGGVVTDRSSLDLAPNELVLLQDGILPRGTLVQRGCWDFYGLASPLGASGKLSGVMAVEFDPLSGISVAIGDTIGRIGYAQSTVVGYTGVANVTYLPRAFAGGEVIFCPQDGVSPILRWKGAVGALVAPAGTVSLTAGSTVVIGVGTTFTTQAPEWSYMGIAPIPGRGLRVAKVDSTTVASLGTPSPITGAGLSWTAANAGYLGLGATLTELGTASTAGLALTGLGTYWNQGLAQAKAGDIWAQRVAGGAYTGVSVVNNNTSITLASAPGGLANVLYRIIRPAFGRDACVHRGRLYWSASFPFPNRYWYSPPGYDLGRPYNERENYISNFVDAYPADFWDVPAPQAQGRIEALLSGGDPGPLLLLRNDSVWGMFGDAAAPDHRLLADGAGCVSLRSACSGYGVQAWCGPDGIYLYRNGTIEDITEGKRGRAWRYLMANRSSSAIICAGIDSSGHLIVSYNDGGVAETWPYDLRAGVWLGNFTGMTARYISAYRPAPVSEGDPTQAAETYWIPESGMGGSVGRQVAMMAPCFRDDGLAANTSHSGTLLAQTGATLVGPIGDLARVTDMKVTYECYSATLTPTLTVSTSINAANMGDELALPESTSGVPATARIRTVTDSTLSPAGNLGEAGGAFGIKFTQTGGKPDYLRVHQVELVVRKRRVRVAA